MPDIIFIIPKIKRHILKIDIIILIDLYRFYSSKIYTYVYIFYLS